MALTLTGPLSRTARALVELTREQLSTHCGLDAEAIRLFERGLADLDRNAREKLKASLEAAGAVFIPENGGGVGVRLKFNRSETKRISILEGEGGIAADDDVP